MIEMIYLFILGVLIVLSYHYGYLNIIPEWFRTKYQRMKFLYGVVQKLQEKETVESFRVNSMDDSATIAYTRLARDYRLTVPYSRRHVATMCPLRVELVYDDTSRLEITQQPGIPYSFTAKELGGHSIVVTNTETGTTHIYYDRPMFAPETLDTE